MDGSVQVRNLSHATGHIPVAGTCAGTVHYCLGMTDVAGKTCLHMTRMGVGPRRTWPLIGEHRHGAHPFAPRRPTGLFRPDFAGNWINSAVVTTCIQISGAGLGNRMAVAGIAMGFRLRPGEGTDLLRIGGAVTVTIDILAYHPVGIVTGNRAVVDVPVRVDSNIFYTIDMLCSVSHISRSINGFIMTVVTGILPNPLRADKAVMPVGRHGEIRGAVPFRGAPDPEASQFSEVLSDVLPLWQVKQSVVLLSDHVRVFTGGPLLPSLWQDRKSTRLNSSHT